MIWKRPDSSCKHSHQKITKSFEKALDIKYRIGQASQLIGACAQINLQSNTNKFTHIKYRIRAVVRFYAFFILHRKERKALSFAQVRKGL
ncbi:hypothetical protein [Treponema sp. OMZ 789]|uniref:hypothetical protein n=1 Tax=Treponema sp. OMZ 789 TaxID=2563670 RepID=UPI0020A24D02|nr:hypothetical protein [Treponema sp. OMZ 789]